EMSGERGARREIQHLVLRRRQAARRCNACSPGELDRLLAGESLARLDDDRRPGDLPLVERGEDLGSFAPRDDAHTDLLGQTLDREPDVPQQRVLGRFGVENEDERLFLLDRLVTSVRNRRAYRRTSGIEFEAAIARDRRAVERRQAIDES